MRSKENNIYAFFLLLALLFFNPVSFYIFYSDTPAYTIRALFMLFWLIPMVGVFICYLLIKNRLPSVFKDALFFASFAGIFTGTLVTSNHLIQNSPDDINREGLIFDPNTEAHYSTVEFDYLAKINSLGLREYEFDPLKKAEQYRILCFGDSWTYGWGVNIEDSWPKQLESFLASKGATNIEVINCGQGGQYTSTYKEHMREIVPILKPDLVLIGVLQFNDLFQLYANREEEEGTNTKSPTFWSKLDYIASCYVEYSLGNLITALKPTEPKKFEIQDNWKDAVDHIIDKFEEKQRLQFHALEDTVRKLYISGNLNPGLLQNYLLHPNRVSITNTPSHELTQFAVSRMKEDFEEMKVIANTNNCQLVFVNLPTHFFTGHKVTIAPSDSLNLDLLRNNKIDSIYESVASFHGLDYIELTSKFVQLEEKTKYFYPFDSHPNKYGYQEIAQYVGSQLLDKKIVKK